MLSPTGKVLSALALAAIVIDGTTGLGFLGWVSNSLIPSLLTR